MSWPTLWRQGSDSSPNARRLNAMVSDAKFVSFWGCPRWGLHVDDGEAAACRRCALSAGTIEPSPHGSWKFEDDRGTIYGGQSYQATPWPHARSLDQHGRLHRDHGPAVVADGIRIWARHGRVWRDGGLPAVEGDTVQAWTDERGRLHRDGTLPALQGTLSEYNAPTIEHWVHGDLSRRDAAALSSDSRADCFIDGVPVTHDDLWRRWLLDEAGIAMDNTEAQDHLRAALAVSDDPRIPFPALDADAIAVAKLLFPSMTVTA